MSVNRERPHVLVLPEDDANRQLANGFLLVPSVDARRIQVLSSAGGCPAVRDQLLRVHLSNMERYTHRYVVLVVDFDGDARRRETMIGDVPPHLTDRVFILGAWTEAEDLRKSSGRTLEQIGTALADGCVDELEEAWDHELLKHNGDEVARMTPVLRPILFPNR